MRISGSAIMITAALLGLSPVHGGSEATDGTALAQADLDMRAGPDRTPNVLVEEPRPPSIVIETEGRGERPFCRDVVISEWREGVNVTRTAQRCER
jgi:hypothetical protein